MDKARALKLAQGVSPCTCSPPLKSGHYANCPSENVEDIADLLLSVAAEQREADAVVCEKSAERAGKKGEYRNQGQRLQCAAAIRAGGE